MVTEGVPYSAAVLARVLGWKLKKVESGLAAFEGLGMIDRNDGGIYISNWSKYQSVDKLEQRRLQDRQRKQAQRERERKKQMPPSTAEAEAIHVTPSDASRDVTPQTRANEEGEEERTTNYSDIEQEAMSMLIAAKLDCPSPTTLRYCLKKHGESALMGAVDAAVVAAKNGHKIKCINAYVAAVSKDFVPPEQFIPWPERRKQKTDAEAKKQKERQNTALEEKAEADRAAMQDAYWDSLSEEAREMWFALVELKCPNLKNKELIEIGAKVMALEEHEG